MKYVAFICFALSLSFKSIGQDTSDEDVDEYPCIHYNTSIQELRKFKGYRDVYKIYLVSFSANEDDIGQMPLKDGSADLTQMFEAILLNDSQRDSLLLLLHNYANTTGIESGAACYDPHNGIVFQDKKGKSIGYLELCFGCSHRKAVGIVPTNLFCREKWNMLKKIFVDAGIKFGYRYENGGVLMMPDENGVMPPVKH